MRLEPRLQGARQRQGACALLGARGMRSARRAPAHPGRARVGHATISSGMARSRTTCLTTATCCASLRPKYARWAGRCRTAGCRPSPRRGNGQAAPRPPAPLPARRDRPTCRIRAGISRRRSGRTGCHAGRLRRRRVACLVARVAGQVLRRPELRRIDEQADDRDVVARRAGRHQRQVAGVERAHGRHQPDRAAGGPPAANAATSHLRRAVRISLHGRVASARAR